MVNRVWMNAEGGDGAAGAVGAYVTHAIQNHVLEEDHAAVTVGRLADAAGMDRYRLLRQFQKLQGEDLRQHIVREKMRYAEVRIQLTEVPILHVAAALGYACQQSFTRCFSRHFGQSPGQMRRQARQEWALASWQGAGEAGRVRLARQSWWLKSYRAPPAQFKALLGRFRVELLRLGMASHLPVRVYRYQEMTLPDAPQVTVDFGVGAPQPGPPPSGWIALQCEASDFRAFRVPSQSGRPAGRWQRSAVWQCARVHGESLGRSGVFWQAASMAPAGREGGPDESLWVSVD